ncbi:MAG TPA: hypothetical protein VK784_16810 [Pseudonocardiaceae bacterium]|nr:hypothetical protein [Pseudonocardiaceae bacterium]
MTTYSGDNNRASSSGGLADCSGAANPNYTISYLPGTVTVAKAGQSISFLAWPPSQPAPQRPCSPPAAARGARSSSPSTPPRDRVCTVSGTTVTYPAEGSLPHRRGPGRQR